MYKLFGKPGKMFSQIILLIFLGLLLGACSKSSTTEPEDDNNSNGAMTASLNGSNWSTDEVVAIFSNGILSITGQAFPGGTRSEQIQLNLQGVSAAGTFQLTFTGNSGRVSLATSPTDIRTYLTLDANSGVVEVTELTATSVTGTFTMTVKNANDPTDVINVTNGSFSGTF